MESNNDTNADPGPNLDTDNVQHEKDLKELEEAEKMLQDVGAIVNDYK